MNKIERQFVADYDYPTATKMIREFVLPLLDQLEEDNDIPIDFFTWTILTHRLMNRGISGDDMIEILEGHIDKHPSKDKKRIMPRPH